MQDELFEWDDAKAASNWHLHTVTFEMARDAFGDAFAIEWIDNRQGVSEERYGMLGFADHVLLCVSFTLRADRIRIISARKAEPHERRRYHNENREA
jgi:uncharacterized DUF497 family protein